MTSGVPFVPPNFVNGPDDDVELNTWYHVAPADAVQDTVIELDDFAVAVTPVGVDWLGRLESSYIMDPFSK